MCYNLRMFISFKRVIKSGWRDFIRNLGLSYATVFIMTMMLCLITLLYLFNPVSAILIKQIQEKIDISVYFKIDAPSGEIEDLQAELAKFPEIRDIVYVSPEQAYEEFVERYHDDPLIIESLGEVGTNPFPPSFNIKSWEASQYLQINTFLETSQYGEIIDKVDYFERKPVIDQLFTMINFVNRTGIGISLALAVVSVLVAFSTVRIAIYNASEEIATMRLVGASNWFIRGPFLIQGIIAGFVAAFATLVITFTLMYFVGGRIDADFIGFNLWDVFRSHGLTIVLLQFGIGIVLGAVSSAIAIRKYLKI